MTATRAGVASTAPARAASRAGCDAAPEEGCRIATPSANETRINDRIRAREVRLVAEDGTQLGIKALPEALSIAREADLDLVEVAPTADPPVCRIMNYSRWKYDEAQRAKESRRKATSVSIKEMKYRPKIAGGDFDTKTRKVEEFLRQGHKVKLTIMFRYREQHHPEFGRRILDQVAERVADIAKVEAAPRLDGRNMTMVLAPDKRAQASHAATAHGKPRKGAGPGEAEAATAEAVAPDGATAEAAPPAAAPDATPTNAAPAPAAPAVEPEAAPIAATNDGDT